MLIYNFQKEFLGIDDKDLKILGFNTLEELRSEVTDFADLFVKTPGYVHNFKHVHWIDFINYADVSEESKVLINVNAKTFKATLSVTSIYLIDNPTSPAYMIQLNHLRPLSKSENANLSSDVLDRELPKVEPQEKRLFKAAAEVAPVVTDAYDNIPHKQTKESDETLTIDEEFQETLPAEEELVTSQTVNETPKLQETEISTDENKELDIHELSLDVFEEETPEPVVETPTAPKTIKKELVQEAWDNGYQYDPHIASKELGLPLDLIEEFIQDFIAQAKEFKDDIYNSIEEGDVDNVKILSHKLKGVAANLRIEDAHEVLSAVSATSDMDVIHENLDTFYKIIAKLAGEPTQISTIVEDEDIDDEFITLDFKDDDLLEEPTLVEDTEELLSIDDEDVPNKIEMPELADDDFLELTDDENLANELLLPEENKQEEPKLNFSKSDAAREIGIDETSFNELFEDYIAESHTILQKINEAIQNDDMQRIKNEAVKFKGMSDNMRFKEFSQELETLIHSTDKEKIIQAEQAIDATLKKISEIGV